jgi:hypothetical protein
MTEEVRRPFVIGAEIGGRIHLHAADRIYRKRLGFRCRSMHGGRDAGLPLL